ncbi:MAG: V4R domain-containing protein [Acidobacteriota bacterium]
MTQDLSHLATSDIDGLPFGYIALAPDGTVRKYNRYEADLARKDPQDVLGKNFFREVAPCTQVREFEGRFHAFASGHAEPSTLSFDFEFRFRHGTQKVRIGFVRSPLEREVIVTVNRLRTAGLPFEARLAHDPVQGRWHDAAGAPVVPLGLEFFTALDELVAGRSQQERRDILHRLGRAWGRRKVEELESFVQKRHERTLREVELHVALESLSGSLGLVGLGSFEVQLDYRDRGLLLINHHHSPFAATPLEHDEPRCAVLAGLHAAFLSHLSGRELVAREVSCSRRDDTPCRFVAGVETRVERFFDAEPGSTDADLRAGLLDAGVTDAPGSA